MEFREDINALRAFAVISVALYHFFPQSATGGFAGVDVFFVISGYLMTAIILSGIKSGTFGIHRFYLSRAARVLPALAALCVVLAAIGFYYLPPLEYQDLGKHVASSMLFFSNIVYWREISYFSTFVHDNWLLHTWSLSIELQFYILYPIGLLLLAKLRLSNMIASITIAAALVSFGISAYGSAFHPAAAFYTLPPRIWEFLVGALAYHFPMKLDNRSRLFASYSGLTLILLGVAVIDRTDLWPSYMTLIPALGTFLVLTSQCNENRIFAAHTIRWIGTRSYSIYLWHWPLVCALYYSNLYPNPLAILAAILASLLFAEASYRFVETPFRRTKHNTLSVKRDVEPRVAFLSLWLVSCAFGAAIYALNGIPQRASEAVIIAEMETQSLDLRNCARNPGDAPEAPPCRLGAKEAGTVKAILLGDSHAAAVAPALVEAVSSKDGAVVLSFARNSCPAILGAKNRYRDPNQDNCESSILVSLEEIVEKYPGTPVFVVSRYSVYAYGQTNPKRLDSSPPLIYFTKVHREVGREFWEDFETHLQKTLCEISVTNPVYVLLPVPEIGVHVSQELARAGMIGRLDSEMLVPLERHSARTIEIASWIKMAADSCNAQVLDPAPALCDAENCYGTSGDKLLYIDGDHLSNYGSKRLVPLFQAALSKHEM